MRSASFFRTRLPLEAVRLKNMLNAKNGVSRKKNLSQRLIKLFMGRTLRGDAFFPTAAPRGVNRNCGRESRPQFEGCFRRNGSQIQMPCFSIQTGGGFRSSDPRELVSRVKGTLQLEDEVKIRRSPPSLSRW